MEMMSQVGDLACIDHNNNTALTRPSWHCDRFPTKEVRCCTFLPSQSERETFPFNQHVITQQQQ